MNPFLPYAAAYGPGAVEERPWWSLEVVPGEPVQTSYPPGYVWQTVRTDGRAGIRLGYAKERGAARLVTEEVIAALDAIDAEHPLPCPPPACGQVWAFVRTPEQAGLDGWLEATITERDVKCGLPYFLRWSNGTATTLRVTGWDATGEIAEMHRDHGLWPPRTANGAGPSGMRAAAGALDGHLAGAVLVAGPFAPWAPVGWRP